MRRRIGKFHSQRMTLCWPVRGTVSSMVLSLMVIGLAVTLDPLPLTAFIVILPSKRGTVKGAAYVFGWLASLAIVVTITVAATGNNPPKPSTAPSLAALADRKSTR